MSDKMVETIGSKFRFSASWIHFPPPPFPPKQCWFSYFFDCTDHSTYATLNWGAGGIRELTLDSNKMKQMLKYRKASFPKSVSTTFLAHCSFVLYSVFENSVLASYLVRSPRFILTVQHTNVLQFQLKPSVSYCSWFWEAKIVSSLTLWLIIMARNIFSTILMSDFNSRRQPIAISLLCAFFTVFCIQSAFYAWSIFYIPSAVRVLYLVRVSYPVRSPRFILTG